MIEVNYLSTVTLSTLLAGGGKGSKVVLKGEHPKSGRAASLWLLEGGKLTRHPKVGRNDPCPCGSGRKHKRCCL